MFGAGPGTYALARSLNPCLYYPLLVATQLLNQNTRTDLGKVPCSDFQFGGRELSGGEGTHRGGALA